jgi:hypothetical protein
MELARHEGNDFGRRYLHKWEVCALYKARYMAPPYFHCPSTWRLSVSGISLDPHGAASVMVIHKHLHSELTPEQREIKFGT